MTCPKVLSPVCVVTDPAHAVSTSIGSSLIDSLSHSVHAAVASTIAGFVDWWINIPSPNLASEPSVQAVQHWLMPVTVAVALGATLAGAAKMTLTRKANPLVDVGAGLAVLVVTLAIGVLLPELLIRAGDAWSSWVLTESADGRFGRRLTEVLSMQSAPPLDVIMFGTLAIVLTFVQAVLMAFRQVAVIILAGVLPLSAAGMLAPSTRRWFRRTTGWMLAFILYKPAAAAVYATAFTLVGNGRDPRTIVIGFAMVFMSLLALPALMKFFTWATVSVDNPAGGGGLLGTALNGAIAIGAVRGASTGPGGSSPVDQARLLAAELGASSSGGTGSSGQGQAGQASPQGAAPSHSSGFGAQRPAPAGPQGASGTQAGSAAAAGASGAASSGAATGATAAAAAAGAAAGPAGAAAVAATKGAARATRRIADSLGPDGKDG